MEVRRDRRTFALLKPAENVLADVAGLKENFILKACYHFVDKAGQLAAVLGSVVDDLLVAIRPDHYWVLEKIETKLIFGKKEWKTFRLCGREIVQDSDFNVTITCKHTTLKIGEINITSVRNKTPDADVTPAELHDYMSVTGSLPWVARVCRADLSYNVSQLQQHKKDAKVRTLRLANKVIRFAKAHAMFVSSCSLKLLIFFRIIFFWI